MQMMMLMIQKYCQVCCFHLMKFLTIPPTLSKICLNWLEFMRRNSTKEGYMTMCLDSSRQAQNDAALFTDYANSMLLDSSETLNSRHNGLPLQMT
mmetsp:Transcript_9617/g.14352  ORF Transcript_9617/g.14352 Transcript_9617/m.14352 type:complete len:95 (+) Transcript_9617:399-683(+)